MFKKYFFLSIGAACIAMTMLGASVDGAQKSLVVSGAFPANIDPALGSDHTSVACIVNLYDALIYPDVYGNPTPHLAERWETSADGLTWKFFLKKGVTFHDGAECTAEDVKYSMERVLAVKETSQYKGVVKNVTVDDPYTVTFTLNKPFGPFLSTFFMFYIVNKDLVEKNSVKPGKYGAMGDYGLKFLSQNDAGTGMYSVKSCDPDKKVVMTLSTNYWKPLDKGVPDQYVMIPLMSPEESKNAMMKGDLDICDRWQSEEGLAIITKAPGGKAGQYMEMMQLYFMINTKKKPTDDVHFRKAMAYAFDYKTVTSTLFPGSALSSGPVPTSTPGAAPVSPYKLDLKKATEELKLSKYAANPAQYPVEIHISADVPAEVEATAIFKKNLAQLGIDVNVTKKKWGEMVEEMKSVNTAPHIEAIFADAQYPEAGSLLKLRYHSSTIGTWQQNEFLQDAKFDAMMDAALGTVDKNARFAKYREIQQYIVDLCPSLFVADMICKQAYNSEYVDWASAKAQCAPISGYALHGRNIKVNPAKKILAK